MIFHLLKLKSARLSPLGNAGPTSHLALARLLPPSVSLAGLTFSRSLHIKVPSLPSSPTLHICRGGYTGEDGFEISVPEDPSATEILAQMLLDQPEVKLAGLAARDSLRLEAGLCLYGHDLDEGTGIGEAGLAWVVGELRGFLRMRAITDKIFGAKGKDRRTPGAFIGAERTLGELKKGGTSRKRTGLVVEKGPPARGTPSPLNFSPALETYTRMNPEGAKIFSADGASEIGIVTSGLPSPTLGKNISMGYIQTKDGLNMKGTQVLVEVRKKMRKAEVVGMPFTPAGYYRG